NLFGLGIHSANSIDEAWKDRAVGELVYGDARGRGGWYVMEARPDDALVLKTANVKLGRPLRREEGIGWEFLWTFAVRPNADGTTRLLVRERVGFGNGLVRFALAPMGFVSFVMTRKMLLGIKVRVEQTLRRR
ncbi:MAG TPA: hypothetical protein VE197_16885, partial [Mycobacterium sp.]|nr:hypothetical protein [Mycobacterium sp.]